MKKNIHMNIQTGFILNTDYQNSPQQKNKFCTLMKMNLQQANKILDRHKEGSHAYSLLTITKALYLTGDIGTHEELRSARLDQEIPGEDEGGWTERSQEMVG